MGNKQEKKNIIIPLNKSPLENIDIDKLIEKFKNDPKAYSDYLQKTFKIFSLDTQCDSTLNLNKNFIPNVKNLTKKILSITKESSHDKYMALSCILGAFMGDAMGDNCEFHEKSPDNYLLILSSKGDWPVGEITDDSETAMSIAYSIMDSPEYNSLDQKFLFFYHGVWFKTKPITVGATTKRALCLFNYDENYDLIYNNTSELKQKNDKIMELNIEEIKKRNDISLSNGLLMRLSSLHVWYYYMHKQKLIKAISTNDKLQFLDIYNDIKSELIKDSHLSHPNDEISIVGSIYSFMVQCAMLEILPKDIINKMNILLNNDIFNEENSIENKVKLFIVNTIKDFDQIDFNYIDYFDNLFENMGYYRHAIKLSLYYLYNFEKIKLMKGYNKFRTIMNEISNFGGDADTNSAIVGQLIGPLIGFDNFGNKELSLVLNYVPPSRFQYSSSLIYFFIDYLDKNYNKENKFNLNIPRFNFIRFLLNMVYTSNFTKNLE